jgi:hypothetical protein
VGWEERAIFCKRRVYCKLDLSEYGWTGIRVGELGERLGGCGRFSAKDRR